MNRKSLLALVAAALMFTLVVPVAEAQTVAPCSNAASATMKVKSAALSDNTVQPITGLKSYTVTFSYSTETQGTSVTQIAVEYSVSSDKSWATPTLSKLEDFVTVKQNDATAEELPVDVTVVVGQNAPAFEKAKITVTAAAKEGACVPASNTAKAETLIQAGFYENYQARFDQAIWKIGQNERIQIPLSVQNFGNGAVRVQFAQAEGTSGALSLALPGPQVVDSTISGDSNQLNIPIDVQTPFKNGYENRRDNLLIDITGASAFDTNIKLTPLQLSAVIQTQGVYVPGFEAMSLMAAAVGLAAMARFRR